MTTDGIKLLWTPGQHGKEDADNNAARMLQNLACELRDADRDGRGNLDGIEIAERTLEYIRL